MALEITRREAGGATILELRGRLVYGTEADQLRAQIKQALADGVTRIVLNLEKVTYSDSAGLGCLAASFASVQNRGGKLMLVGPQGRVAEVLQLTRLEEVLAIFSSEEEALQSRE